MQLDRRRPSLPSSLAPPPHFPPDALAVPAVPRLHAQDRPPPPPLPVSKLLAAASSLAEPAYALSIFHCIASPCLFHHTAVLRSLSSSPGARSVADAFSLFRSLHASPGLALNQFAFIPALKVLAQGLRLQLWRQLHALALKLGFLLYVNVRNTLIHLYCRCDRVSDDGLHLFDEMPLRDDRVISLGKVI
ncbi:pentatricopeptide repeat-containing protein At1g26900, mitochondrial-like [Zingiber officinale]|uniref:pentatricopeptide repeat-containing protein At1g26900, mitochondrial-like n=1 Tax=Zingiber officinale TaxID=94328 RepID=UPI001C4AB64A|nr:pentatricopeptide repeat-containing protein At1g26900, mitochondrial-like [Zingiber officinale]